MSEEKIIERTPQEVHDNIVKLLQENKQLKEVIEEVRELKDEYVCTEEYCGEVGIKTTEFIENLGQILDKVKEK